MVTAMALCSPSTMWARRSACSAMTLALPIRVALRWRATQGLLFLNSGADRILALDPDRKIVRDTGPIEGLNPGGGIFGPDHRYYVGSRERAHHYGVRQRV